MIDYGLLHPMELIPLERDSLLALAQKYPEFISLDFINSCQVTERYNSGSGFFTSFAPTKFLETQTEDGKETILNEIRLTSPNLNMGAAVRLYLIDNQIDFLEVVANSDGNPFDSVQYEFEDEIVNHIEF